jgi:DNA topoisomerase-3
MSYPICPLIPKNKKVLVVCEKPSMARDLLPVLGGSKSGDGFFTFSGGYISWARGHLMEMVPPSSYDPSWKAWSWETLPMIPPNYSFLYEPRGDCLSQLKVLKKLYKEVDLVINACDAGREGELIWWEIMRYCGWGEGEAPPNLGPKLALRFWSQSNTSAGLREAWESMFLVSDRLGLAQGAYSRAEADWLLGLNMTRAATLSFAPPGNSQGKKGFWSIGRVQTPILSLICERDYTIENFVPKNFYQVKATFEGDSLFEATLLVPQGFKAFADEELELGSGGEGNSETGSSSPSSSMPIKEQKAFINLEDATLVMERILKSRPSFWAVAQTTKKSTENPPNLFSLTSLQKWCNKNWGWEAKRTLDAAQAAYEGDKSLTYPRTDAAFLPKDSMGKMDEVYRYILSDYLGPLNYETSLCDCVPSTSSRSGFIFDDSKLTDHYAIVPTGVIPKDFTSDSGKLWQAVVRRFFVSFASSAQASTLIRRLTLGEDTAVTSGKTYDSLGWISLDNELCRLTDNEPRTFSELLPKCGEQTPLLEARVHAGKTSPPKPFTEATLLSLMENIHTKFEDSEDNLKEALGSKGIGTPATRASIIELLIARGYVERKKKGSTNYLRATTDGKTLINNLKAVKLELLTHAQLTAEWESRLTDMENGKGLTREKFLDGIASVVSDCIDVLKTNQSPLARSNQSGYDSVGKNLDVLCPFSQQPVRDHGTYWVFPHYPNVRFYKTIASRKMEVTEYLDVLRNHSPLFSGFVSSKGKKFNAKLTFDSSLGKFKFEFDNSAGFQGEETKHACPNTGKPITDNGKCWVFPGKQTRFWKVVSGRKMKVSEYIELVKTGSTPYYDNFKSKAGKSFTASLVYDGSLVSFSFNNGKEPAPKNMGMKGPGTKAKKA